MSNIEYIEEFFRKHHLSGKIKIRYSSSLKTDDYISDIVFENGDEININDIIFDIESDFPEDIIELWLTDKRKSDISLMDWIRQDIKYISKNLDLSSVEDYQREMTDIIEDVKKSINSIFEFEIDDGDSDLDDESGDE